METPTGSLRAPWCTSEVSARLWWKQTSSMLWRSLEPYGESTNGAERPRDAVVYRADVSCSYVMMMPFKRQALVEFSELQSADRCVSCGAKEPVYIAGMTVGSVLLHRHQSGH